MKQLIQEIHKQDIHMVLAITGGGSEAISHLLKYGGGSSTVLEAIIPYAAESLNMFLGQSVNCSLDSALILAERSLERAKTLSTKPRLIGIGVTAKLAKEQERVGRQHASYLAIADDQKYSTLTCEFQPNRTRETEEDCTAKLLINLLAIYLNLSSPRVYIPLTYDSLNYKEFHK
jgi:hypothetical protein